MPGGVNTSNQRNGLPDGDEGAMNRSWLGTQYNIITQFIVFLLYLSTASNQVETTIST